MNNRSTKRIKIGLLHRFDVQSIRSWSGIFFFMGKALEKHVGEVIFLGPDRTFRTKFLFNLIVKIDQLLQPLLKKRLVADHNRFFSRRLGAFFQSQLRTAEVDVLFAPAASAEIAYLNTKIPIVYFSDITWKNIVDYYPEYSSLSSVGKMEGENIEKRAIRRARAVIYPSAWPAQTAHEHYHAPTEKIFQVPFGANLQEVPTRELALQHRVGDQLELLWVGVDWIRKGGPVAFECLTDLLASGIHARLTICGCSPPEEFTHPQLRVFKFLNKHDPEQRKILTQLFLEANFFILPTKADATPIVIPEASAHGLPSLITDTGGISGALEDGKNGFRMPLTASGKDYADKIRAILKTPGEYEDLVRSSRDLFEERLNWDAWGISIRPIIHRVLSEN